MGPAIDERALPRPCARRAMTYVITAPCIDVKDGECLNVCPVDCIYVGGRMMYIQPDECVNCGLCDTVCPVDAIFVEDKVPEKWRAFIAVNREFFDDEVSGLGMAGGYDEELKTDIDHATVAAAPRQE